MKQYIVDAFTSELFSGNPAAVLPCRQMPPADLMQKIAVENNYSETAFVVRREAGRYDLKWFTPGGEVELCGHATLATSFVLYNFVDPGVPEMHFDTLSGELVVRASEDGFTMDFPVGKYKPVPVTPDIMAATGGLALEAFYDGGDMIVVVPSEEALVEFAPDFELMKRVEGRGLVMTAPSARFDFVSRCFYPKLDVPEDPVTGSAHTYLAPLWASRLGLSAGSDTAVSAAVSAGEAPAAASAISAAVSAGEAPAAASAVSTADAPAAQLSTGTLLTCSRAMHARQISRRGGDLTVRLGEGRVYITGAACLFMSGDIPFDL